MDKRTRQHKYYLHYKCRCAGLVLDTKKRTFFIIHNNAPPDNRWYDELRERFGYAVQLLID